LPERGCATRSETGNTIDSLEITMFAKQRRLRILVALGAVGLWLGGMWAFPGASQAQNATVQKSQEAVKYWVLFEDKSEGLGKGTNDVEPGYISQRALERRRLRGRKLVTALDAPIASRYERAITDLGIRVIHRSRWLNGVSVWLSSEQAYRLRGLPFIREVRPVGRVLNVESAAAPAPIALPAAPLFEYGASRQQLKAINAIQPLEAGYDGSGVRVGFLDTTFDPDHPAFDKLVVDGRLVDQEDFTGEIGPTQANKHGLYTSSTAVGFAEGSLIGACHGGELLLATTEYAPTETNQEEDAFVAGMEWMERMGADIVNVSLGYSEFDAGQNSYVYDDMNGDKAITTVASDRAAELGVVVVASAGNEGCSSPESCWYYITSPADGDSVIAVGATDFSGNRASFSGFGPSSDGRVKPDVSAPGLGVVFANAFRSYSFGNGTSFSAPLTTSVVCQVLQANPNLNPHEVKTILTSTASQATRPDSSLGYGVIDATAAVDEALSMAVVRSSVDDVPSVSQISVYPNPFVDRLTIRVTHSDRKEAVRVRIVDVLGRPVETVFEGELAPGKHSFSWNPDGIPAGVYVVAFELDTRTMARPVVLGR
jgi:subtilisin family serine protease